MARKTRVEVNGGLYHVMARGNRREPIFFEEEDRAKLMSGLARARAELDTEVHAFALMTNHLHLVLRRRHETIGRFMHLLLFRYARHVNRRHGLVGHVFQGRYKALLCDDESYLLRLVRYVHWNPMRAGLCRTLHYRWSSYGTYLDGSLSWVDTAPVLRLLGKDPARARETLREFHESLRLEDQEIDARFEIFRSPILGDDEFDARALRRAGLSPSRLRPIPLDLLLARMVWTWRGTVSAVQVRGTSRRHAIAHARAAFARAAIEEHGHSAAAVAGYLGRDPANLRMLLWRWKTPLRPVPTHGGSALGSDDATHDEDTC